MSDWLWTPFSGYLYKYLKNKFMNAVTFGNLSVFNYLSDELHQTRY